MYDISPEPCPHKAFSISIETENENLGYPSVSNSNKTFSNITYELLNKANVYKTFCKNGNKDTPLSFKNLILWKFYSEL